MHSGPIAYCSDLSNVPFDGFSPFPGSSFLFPCSCFLESPPKPTTCTKILVLGSALGTRQTEMRKLYGGDVNTGNTERKDWEWAEAATFAHSASSGHAGVLGSSFRPHSPPPQVSESFLIGDRLVPVLRPECVRQEVNQTQYRDMGTLQRLRCICLS